MENKKTYLILNPEKNQVNFSRKLEGANRNILLNRGLIIAEVERIIGVRHHNSFYGYAKRRYSYNINILSHIKELKIKKIYSRDKIEKK